MTKRFSRAIRNRTGATMALLSVLCCGPTFAAGEPESRPAPELEPAFLSGYGRAPGRPSFEAKRHGSTLVLRGAVNGPGGETVVQSVCLLCTTAEASTAARSLGADLAMKVGGAAPALFRLDGVDQGTARLDGLPFEAAQSAAKVEPGPHRLEAAADGTARAQDLALAAGAEVELDATDLPLRETPWRPGVAVLTAGLGVAAAAVGGILLWLDGQCASPRVDHSGNCENEHDLVPAGAALIGVGAAAIVGGFVILFTGEAQQAPQTDEEAR
ncbi:MAG: hypothetical protein PHU25_01095 [Deltaproteobacteria bacterium]|nr:hypothetical protein [Deltaproteobacteria bacterium]